MGRAEQSKLDGPAVPDGGTYLWNWFGALQRTRQMSQHGIQAITYAEIAAWAALTDVWPLPHEVDALIDLDVAVRRAVAD